MLHRLGGRRPPGGLRDPGPPPGRPGGDHPRRPPRGDPPARGSDALVATGGSQCGFCTPGIVMRLAALGTGSAVPDAAEIDQALLAHLCRCTGWQTIGEAAHAVLDAGRRRRRPARTGRATSTGPRRRAALEGGVPQRVGPAVVLGDAGFADDGCPSGRPGGGARRPGRLRGGRVAGGGPGPGRARSRAGAPACRSTIRSTLPPGEWDLTLRTTWVEPAYVEPDASWCRPGGEPASPLRQRRGLRGQAALAGGRRRPPTGRRARPAGPGPVVAGGRGPPAAPSARRWPVGSTGPAPASCGWGCPVGGVDRGAWAAVARCGRRGGPRPVARAGAGGRAAGLARPAGRGVGRGRRAGRRGPGPRRPRAGGPVGDVPVEVVAPGGGRAVVRCRRRRLHRRRGGAPGRCSTPWCCAPTASAPPTRRSGWVRSEGIAVDADGAVRDLTMRSFGILQARAMPPVTVRLRPGLDRAARSTGPTPSSPRWPRPAGWPTAWSGSWPTDRAGSGRR